MSSYEDKEVVVISEPAPSGTQDVNVISSVEIEIKNDAGNPVPVSIAPSSTGVNIFASNDSVPSGIETTLLTYTATFPFHISQLIGWGTADAEFLIRVDGIIKGGGRSSPTARTLDVSYEVAPIPVSIGQVVIITGSQYTSADKQLRANLLGE